MVDKYSIFDTEVMDLYIEVDSHYLTLSDAKQAFEDAKTTGKQDDCLMIQVGRIGSTDVDVVINFGVKDGERFALTLLNLCNSIKY